MMTLKEFGAKIFKQQHWWHAPLVLLLVSVAAFGLLAPRLGLYFDDWTAMLALSTDIDLWEFYRFDRPFSAWTFVVFEPLVGLSPLAWQIFTLLVRWLTAWGLYWLLLQLWPPRRREALWMALLFAVHPVFTQQSIAVAYSQHFITYALFVFSLATMLASRKSPRRAWFVAISLPATALHLLTMEYFWGLELLRPVVLWLALAGLADESLRRKLGRFVKAWLPYLLVLILVSLWRFVWLDFAEGDTNSLRLLTYLAAEPLSGTRYFLQTVLRDLLTILVTTWYKALQPELLELDSPFALASWVLVFGSAVLVYFWGWVSGVVKTSSNEDPLWARQALVLGLYAILVGMLPGWLVRRSLAQGPFADRIALPAMLGAAIVLVSVIVLLTSRRKVQLALVSLLVGLAVGAHFRLANEYRWEWVEQRQFYWQLYWRAPALQENTAILTDGALFTHTGEHPTGSAINVLYSDRQGSGQQPYWFFEIDDNFYADMSILWENQPITYQIRNLKFDGYGHDNLVVWYDYPGSCVWVLDEQGSRHPNISDITKAALPVSNLERIILEPETPRPPAATIFGPEPAHNWCYYFQQASTAYHQGDWEAIVGLGQTVAESDFEPNTDNKVEWYPFIEAYARLGEWSQAEKLTIDAYKGDTGVQAMFCAIWADLATSTPVEADRDAVIANVTDFLDCPR